MNSVFWECESVIFVDAMPRGETIISDAYIRTLTEVTNHFKLVQRYNISLLSGWQCKTTHTFEDLESCHKIWFAKYHVHPSPDLAPSDFCLFWVWGMQSIVRSTAYNNVIQTVRTWLWEQEKAWCQQGIPALVPCWHEAVEVDGDFVEKSGVES